MNKDDNINTIYDYYKKNPSDKIYWVDNIGCRGEHLFSFDRKKNFDLFEDYPQNLTEEQKRIFDKENPFWARFFGVK